MSLSIIAQLRATKTLLSQEQLASLIGLKPGTLAARRSRGQEPAFIKVGAAARYDPNVAADWLESQTVQPAAVAPVPAPVTAPTPLPSWLQSTRDKHQITGGSGQ